MFFAASVSSRNDNLFPLRMDVKQGSDGKRSCFLALCGNICNTLGVITSKFTVNLFIIRIVHGVQRKKTIKVGLLQCNE